MNKRTLIQEIAKLLMPHTRLWSHELLFIYPNIPMQQYAEWVAYLEQLPEDELLQFENDMKVNASAPTELEELIKQIQSIQEQIPSINLKPSYYDNSKTHLNRKMSYKKNHEVKIIQDDLAPFMERHQLQSVIDIGAGAAQLSQHLVEKFAVSAHCYEMNATLQQQGMDRLHKYYRHLIPQFHFHHTKVDERTEFSCIDKTLVVGLHACGGLSNQLINHCVKHSFHLYNYGCCYFKADMQTNLSTLAQTLKVELPQDARHLAAHSHHPLTLAMFRARNQSKMYRYPLHFLMQEELNLSNFIAFKKQSVAMENLTFGQYALLQLETLNISHHFTQEKLQAYWQDSQVQKRARELMLLNILRGLFGRLIELYIVLDRALYLEENDFNVEIKQTFDRALSPRNLRIWATPRL